MDPKEILSLSMSMFLCDNIMQTVIYKEGWEILQTGRCTRTWFNKGEKNKGKKMKRQWTLQP